MITRQLSEIAQTFEDATGVTYTANETETGYLARIAAAAQFLGLSHPGFISGRWYRPLSGVVAAGSVLASTVTRLFPFVLRKSVTMAELGARVTTLSAGGNFRLGIYEAHEDTFYPTGTPLTQKGGLSTAATGVVSGAVEGTPAEFEPGLYWGAVQCDNATAIFQVISGAGLMAALIGDDSLASVSSGAAGEMTGLTHNTGYASGLPDLSDSPAFADLSTSSWALLYFKAA